MIASQTYRVDETVSYTGDNARSTDEITATNRFDYAAGEVRYLSRKDGFANYDEATSAPENLSISEEAKEEFINNSNYNPEDYNDASDEMPATGAKMISYLQT